MVVVSDAHRLPSARVAVEGTVAEIDLACSRFRVDSELTALNRAEGRMTRVSPLLLEAVAAALRAAVITEGDVDPTLGGALVALGYDRDFATGLADQHPSARAASPRLTFGSIPGWRTIRLDHAAGTIGLARGVSLDLGATAKALAADRGPSPRRGPSAEVASWSASVGTSRPRARRLAAGGGYGSPMITAPACRRPASGSRSARVGWRPRAPRCATGGVMARAFITSSIPSANGP